MKLQTPESVELLQTCDPSVIHHSMERLKLKMPDSEKQSIGYETMTTVSDLDIEVSFCLMGAT